ncbi:MAG: DUF91 domain-containing protein, partial [Ruminococcaceae bacterium]|nr:DUF91 domain-containing protein [Oscillospiraceae bacterium]
MTHVFIVDTKTFKYHLEYMFAGTGASCDAPFLEDFNYQNPKKKKDGVPATSEKNIVAMIADISRVRPNDKIVFYLQGNNGKGKFYGVFKAAGTPFYDSNYNNYLSSEMGKDLNLRIRIEPDEVYANGVSEHKALDLLDGINHPSEMCWSLIYRKLKGNRGCTMITDYEADKLINKIRNENSNTVLDGTAFSYNTNQDKIITINESSQYEGDTNSVSIKDRLLVKCHRGNAFETHLQAYIVQNCLEQPLCDILLIEQEKATWIGNEVSCGVGMQRIDVVTVQEDNRSVRINIIELKDEEPYDSIITYQLPWYIDWVKNYWCPLYTGKEITIYPIVIAKKTNDRNRERFHNLSNTLVY